MENPQAINSREKEKSLGTDGIIRYTQANGFNYMEKHL